MTLVLSVIGRESIWMMADRRLSSHVRALRDDGRKLMFLDTPDGVAILGYAGLGATALGTEPADWMSAVLRGRNLALEESLGVLAEAMKNQLPRHLIRLAGSSTPAHSIIVTAFHDDKPTLYTINLVFSQDRSSYHFLYARPVINYSERAIAETPRICAGGSGANYLLRDKRWIRNMLDLVRANERRQISAYAVADQFAELNHRVHLGIEDNTVGPRCIVAWRYRRGTAQKYGNGHQFYTGQTRDRNTPSLPSIANGMDIDAIIGALHPQTDKLLKALLHNEPIPDFDQDQMNADFSQLPGEPDENLR